MENNTRIITENELLNFFNAVNGWDVATGKPKVSVAYQCYIGDRNNPGYDEINQAIHTTSKASVVMSRDALNPDWLTVDLVYRSHLEPELRLLWSYLQKYRNNQNLVTEDQCSIAFFSIVQNDSMKQNYGTDDSQPMVAINAMNPFLFFLTSENTDAPGNHIIRMLFHVNCVQFVLEESDTVQDIKAQSAREIASEEYLNTERTITKFDEEAL